MKRLLPSLILLSMASWFCAAETADSVIVMLGNRAIKHSDVMRDVALTAFLNQTTPSYSEAEQKAAADRLVDQMIIRLEIENSNYPEPQASLVDQLWRQVRARYSSDAQLRSALAAQGLQEADLRAALMWQATALQFLDTRFGNPVVLPDEPAPSKSADDELESWLAAERTRRHLKIRWERLK